MTTWLLDLPNHLGSFDLARAAGEGYGAARRKATEGTTTVQAGSTVVLSPIA